MKLIRQLLASKGSDIWSVAPASSVYEAITLMAEKEVGALMVLADGKPVGLVSERDYARKVMLAGRSSKATQVHEIRTKRVICANPKQTIEECMALMTDKRVRHLPVIDHKALVGMISIGDLVKAIIHEQQFIIEQLEHYIAS
jgi:CBS domain-containing protein